MGCIASTNSNCDLTVLYNGKLFNVSTGYSYKQILEFISQKIGNSSTVLSLSDGGNAFRIPDEEAWKNLTFIKKTQLILMVNPEKITDIFRINPIENKVVDKDYKVVGLKLNTFLEKISSFDLHLKEFIRCLSYLYIRSCSLPTAMNIFLVVVNPYITEIQNFPPFVILNDTAKAKLPEQVIPVLKNWDSLMESLNVVEEDINILLYNLNFLLSQRLNKKIHLTSGSRLNLSGLKIAENNIKVHKALDIVKALQIKANDFKETVKHSLNAYSDGRNATMKRVCLMCKKAKAIGPQEISWMFGIGDYAGIPSDIRFY
ncbi:unnamed protein product [Blepharisma stoltei]|uniref:Uncharacterized protein n=1 Tax=Blepharisma stoltei TaxID=1481888 RepID=A0AAU9KBS7_9CILI|nr:unnamed protein product [Blepharisma stoltei]